MGGYLIINFYRVWCSAKIACFRVGRVLGREIGYRVAQFDHDFFDDITTFTIHNCAIKKTLKCSGSSS